VKGIDEVIEYKEENKIETHTLTEQFIE